MMHTMTEPSDPISAYTLDTNTNVYCLECGYNLRGLPGDPRRCPECGHLNPMSLAQLPASAIQEELRRMETNPAVCVGMVLVGGPLTVLALSLVALDYPHVEPESLVCPAIPISISLGIWSVCARGFRRSCRGRPMWKSALWRYHCYALGLCALVAGLMLLPITCYNLLDARARADGNWYLVGCVAFTFAAVVALIFLVGSRVHRRLKETLAPLQREAAVEIALEVLHRRLARARR